MRTLRLLQACFFKGDWFFKFDYKSSYHHIEILPQHCQFLAFSLFFQGKLRFLFLDLVCLWVLIFSLRFNEPLSSTGGVQASEYLHTWKTGPVQIKS